MHRDAPAAHSGGEEIVEAEPHQRHQAVCRGPTPAPGHAERINALPTLRHDPFDRLLLAQALVERCRFLTADRRLLGLGRGLDPAGRELTAHRGRPRSVWGQGCRCVRRRRGAGAWWAARRSW